ncbi:MAG: ferritin-like domain-containing protein [Nitrososphaeraceae archaeon]|nr:ferritin-like domain-containing protein [Nitrososphaeraceae archaeon]
MFNSNNSKNNKLIEFLNEILSAENAGIERLHRRIQETALQESKKILQDHITEAEEQQARLKNLISKYGRKPTDSKADVLSLNSLTTAINNTIKNNSTLNNTTINQTSHNGNNNKNIAMTPKEVEILNTQEDALIKNDEILAYKTMLKRGEKIMAKDVINILKQNLQEKESMYDKIRTFESKMLNGRGENNNHPESFKLGSAVADMLTSYWNSQKSPSKVYVLNRRVHHGAIGALLGLSTLYKNNPIVTGILSGLGAGLQKDDYNDSKEWFLFKKKEDEAKENK